MTKEKAIVCTLLCLVLAGSARGGWQYTAVTQGGGEQKSTVMNTTIKGLADGGKARIEFTQSGNPMMPAGSYMISKDGGATMYLVNPKEKKYTKWDMQSMMGMAGGAMKMMGMTYTSPKVEKLIEEDGPVISGFPTRHARYRTSYTMQMNFMGIRQSTDTIQEEDVWTTSKLDDAGLGVWLNQQGMKTGNEELDKLMQAETGKIKGFPLKRTIVTTTKKADGTTEKTSLTSEVTAISEASPAASAFELPAGYVEQAMFPAAGGDGGAADENPLLKMMQQMNRN